MRHLRLLAIVLLFLGATLSWAPSVAEASGAQERVHVDLGLTTVRDIEYVAESDRIVVVGDDEAQIFTREGIRTGRITGISGSLEVGSSGIYAVVAAPGTGELVVIDTTTAVVTKRIQGGAQGISSISVVGDTIWYHHGPSQHDAGIGKASISAGTATPNFLDGHYTGGLIRSAPGRPDSVFYAPSRISPADIRRFDADGTELDSPYHETFRPFIPADSGDVVYAYSNGNLVEMDGDTLERTGFFFERLASGERFNELRMTALAIHNDEKLVQGFGSVAALYDIDQAAIQHTIQFRSNIQALDLSEYQLFVAEGGQSTSLPTYLTIVPLDYVPEPLRLDLWVEGYGAVASAARPTLSWSCSSGYVDSVLAQYGHLITLQLPPEETYCDVRLTSVSGLVSASLYTDAGEGASLDRIRVNLTGDREKDYVVFFHVYPTVYNDHSTFINQQYLDLVDRPATQPEIERARGRLASGTVSRAGLVSEIVASDDFLGSVAPLSRIYLAYFGRWPDEPGLSYWLIRNRSDLTLDQTSNFFAGSYEFNLVYGKLNDEEFVRLVYKNVLERSPDGSGLSYWTGQLAAGLSRGELMTGFSESPENISKVQTAIIVRSLYHGLLEREPDAEGFDFWSGVHRSGQPIDAMIAGFLEGDEYFDRFWIVDRNAGLKLDSSRDQSVDDAPSLRSERARDLLGL